MIGALIGAGASLLGGLMNRQSQKDANEANMQNALRQEALQKEFAQSGIQWKVEDARKAGVHPLYALGANTISYSPSSVGNAVADTSLGSPVAASGQDSSRALHATRTGGDRNAAFDKTVQDLSLQKMGLENQLLSTQIAKMRGQIGPPMPALNTQQDIPGQWPTTVVPLDKKGPDAAPNLGIHGYRWQHDPGMSNADEFEKRYGELSDYVAGPYVLWKDMLYNSNKYFLPNGPTAPRGNRRHISEVFDFGGFNRAHAPRR